MKGEFLKRKMLECLLLILGIALISACYLAIYYFTGTSKTMFLAVYCSLVPLFAFVIVWDYFLFPRLMIRRCRNCGSKNLFPKRGVKGTVCYDCGYVYYTDAKENTKIKIIEIAIPVSLVGVFSWFGCTLAGETGLVRFSLFFLTPFFVWWGWLPTLLLGLPKLLNKMAYFNRNKDAAMVLVISIIFSLTMGIFIPMGAIVLGTPLDRGWISFGLWGSVMGMLFLPLLVVLKNLFNRIEFFEEHETFGLILFFTTYIVLFVFGSIGCTMVIWYASEWLWKTFQSMRWLP